MLKESGFPNNEEYTPPDVIHIDARGQRYLAGLQVYSGVKEGIETDPILNEVLTTEFATGNTVVRGIHRYCRTEEDRRLILEQIQEQGIDTQVSYNPRSGESLHMIASFAGDKSWSQALPYTVDPEQDPPREAAISMGLVLIYENEDGRIVYNTGNRFASKEHPIPAMDMKRRDDEGSIMVLDENATPQFNSPQLAEFWRKRLKNIIVIEYPVEHKKKNTAVRSLLKRLF